MSLTPKMQNVLLIDDEEICKRSMELLLYDTSFKLLSANSGHEALDILKVSADKISCVLLDIKMPDINGLDLIKHIRDIPEAYNMPIIIQTGLISYKDRMHYYLQDVSAYIIKPYSRRELLGTMERVIKCNKFILSRVS